ncbi:hypothetical protein HYW54_03240 [Candidatus Gottesmanbacteria bacterium]|nr:hypothetical protein [Candidatus Gottesmanbacteria bacterium]
MSDLFSEQKLADVNFQAKVKNSLTTRLHLGRALNDQDKANFLDEAVGEARRTIIDPPQRKMETSDAEFFNAVLKETRDKLGEIGIDSPDQLLPSPDQIIVWDKNIEDGTDTHGDVSAYGGYVNLKIVKDLPVNSPDAKRVLIHELSHYITQSTVVKDAYGDIKVNRRGFNRIENDHKKYGVIEESTAELFTLFCTDGINPTSYSKQVPFMMALINKYAGDRQMSELEFFKKLFKAKVFQDERELLQLLDPKIVKQINNIRVKEAGWGISDPSQLTQIAQENGFGEKYLSLQNAIDTGEVIHFPGLNGGIKKGPVQSDK